MLYTDVVSHKDVVYGIAGADFVAETNLAARGGCAEREAVAYDSPRDLFERKFRHWRGRSGRSHAFSVYTPQTCPAYADAVLIVAHAGGARTPLACLDLGPLPDLGLARLRRTYAGRLDEIEFHIHVLADRAADRLTLIADLAPEQG